MKALFMLATLLIVVSCQESAETQKNGTTEFPDKSLEHNSGSLQAKVEDDFSDLKKDDES